MLLLFFSRSSRKSGESDRETYEDGVASTTSLGQQQEDSLQPRGSDHSKTSVSIAISIHDATGDPSERQEELEPTSGQEIPYQTQTEPKSGQDVSHQTQIDYGPQEQEPNSGQGIPYQTETDYGPQPIVVEGGGWQQPEAIHPMFESLPQELPSYNEGGEGAYGYGYGVADGQGYATQGYDTGYYPQDNQGVHPGYADQGYQNTAVTAEAGNMYYGDYNAAGGGHGQDNQMGAYQGNYADMQTNQGFGSVATPPGQHQNYDNQYAEHATYNNVYYQ